MKVFVVRGQNDDDESYLLGVYAVWADAALRQAETQYDGEADTDHIPEYCFDTVWIDEVTIGEDVALSNR